MEKFRVLIVDDEEDLVDIIVKRLRGSGLEAKGATGGKQALALLHEEEFDVCVLDVKMPGMDGIETLAEMKKKWPALEVVMLTGHGSAESGIRGLQLGAYDYLMKPVPFEDLLNKIIQAYERKVIEQERTRGRETQ